MAQEQQEKIFADGFVFKRNEKAPDFVVGRLSIKVDDATAFIKAHEKSGWVNLNVKTARSGNFYIELDTFNPTQKNDSAVDNYEAKKETAKAPAPAPAPAQQQEEEDDDLPF